MNQVKLLRRPAVEAAFAKARSSVYDDIKSGLLTRPVKLSRRCACWPSNEIDALVHARIRGEDNAAIKALVDRLHLQRATSGEVAA